MEEVVSSMCGEWYAEGGGRGEVGMEGLWRVGKGGGEGVCGVGGGWRREVLERGCEREEYTHTPSSKPGGAFATAVPNPQSGFRRSGLSCGLFLSLHPVIAAVYRNRAVDCIFVTAATSV
jgi:hypothetical protein